VFDEGMKMLDQISGPEFTREVQGTVKNWPRTAEFVGKYYNPNDHSEPTLTDIEVNRNETSKSDRFLTNKSLERKNKNLNGIFEKAEDGRDKLSYSEKVGFCSKGYMKL
jgi:hypothetical protein